MNQLKEKRLPFGQPLVLFSVTLHDGGGRPTIYLTGGLSNDLTQDHLFAFDEQNDDTWKWREGELPRLKEERHSHSSTAVGNNLVVAGGWSDGNYISSIELLNLSVTYDQSSQWVTLKGQGKLTPRVFSVISPLSETKFAILGGIFKKNDLSDVYTVDIETKEVTQKIADCGFGFHCKSYGRMI